MVLTLKRLTSAGSLAMVSFFFSVGCAGTPHEMSQAEPRRTFAEEAEGKAITNQAAVDAKARHFVEIQFEPDTAALTTTSRRSLDRLVSQAQGAGKIDEVLVMSWADEEYPSRQRKQLPKAQKDLAERRNVAIKKYLTRSRISDIETYNMAARPTAFSKWFNTSDSKLKESFVAAGLPTTADDPQYPSKASHAVIFVKVE